MITVNINDLKYVTAGSSFETIRVTTTPDIRPEFALNSFSHTTVYNSPDLADPFSGTIIDLDKLISVVNTVNPQSAFVTETDAIVVQRREHSSIATDDYVDLSNGTVPIWYENGNAHPLDAVQLLRLVGRFLGDQVVLSKSRLQSVSQRAIDNFNRLDSALISFILGLEESTITKIRSSHVIRCDANGRLVHSEEELRINYEDSIGLTTPFKTGVEIVYPDGLFTLRRHSLSRIKEDSGLLLKTSDGGFTQLEQKLTITPRGPSMPMSMGRNHTITDWQIVTPTATLVADNHGNMMALIPRDQCQETIILKRT